MDATELVRAFLTVTGTIFIAELTDKDALLLLSLATKKNPWFVFAAGSIVFTVTSAIIVLIGSQLVVYVPILWIKLAGGIIMLGYAVWQYFGGKREEANLEKKEARVLGDQTKRELYALGVMISSLIVLDLAGDATELITIVFIAQYRDALLVFLAAVTALVGASAVEAALGSRLARLLSAKRIRYLSIAVFLLIGTVIIVTSGIL